MTGLRRRGDTRIEVEEPSPIDPSIKHGLCSVVRAPLMRCHAPGSAEC